ncbi:hypothetical protein GCM10027589_10110 [Actinocorallia lasiicapitis]
MPEPVVSVIVPVYNCRSTILRCVASVLDQSLADLELIVVDDGSDDGTGELLDALEDPRVVVIHQWNSGGPGAPRNAALERARGEFVFFLDADDWLDLRALERMVGAARENDTEIVVGRYVGVGRKVPVRLFQRTVPVTTIENDVPDLYASLAPLKLFRRDLIKDLRFVEGLLSHEDQEFTALAYFRARGVTVLADHDYYYWVEREDGSSVLQLGGAPDPQFFPVIDRVMRLVEAHTEPGPVRDRMLRRNFREEILPRFGADYLKLDDEARRFRESAALRLIDSHLTEGLFAESRPVFRQLVAALRHGDRALLEEIIRYRESGAVPALRAVDGRILELTPGFGTLPDVCFDVTGHLPFRTELSEFTWTDRGLRLAGTAELAGAQIGDLSLALYRRDGAEPRHVLPLGPGPRFSIELDLAELPLTKGRWDVAVVSSLGEVPVHGRLGKGCVGGPGLRLAPVQGAGKPSISPYFTRFYENLTLSVGSGSDLPETFEAEASVPRKGVVEVAALLPVSGPATVRIVARLRGEDGAAHFAPARRDGGRWRAELPVREWETGIWRLGFEVVAGDTVLRGALRPGHVTAGMASFGRIAVPYETSKGRLAVRISRRGLAGRIRKRLGPLLPSVT